MPLWDSIQVGDLLRLQTDFSELCRDPLVEDDLNQFLKCDRKSLVKRLNVATTHNTPLEVRENLKHVNDRNPSSAVQPKTLIGRPDRE